MTFVIQYRRSEIASFDNSAVISAHSVDNYYQANRTLNSPPVALPVFLSLTSEQSRRQRRHTAAVAEFAVFSDANDSKFEEQRIGGNR